MRGRKSIRFLITCCARREGRKLQNPSTKFQINLKHQIRMVQTGQGLGGAVPGRETRAEEARYALAGAGAAVWRASLEPDAVSAAVDIPLISLRSIFPLRRGIEGSLMNLLWGGCRGRKFQNPSTKFQINLKHQIRMVQTGQGLGGAVPGRETQAAEARCALAGACAAVWRASWSQMRCRRRLTSP